MKAHPALFVAYKAIFMKEIATIAAFSDRSIKDMHEKIANGDGGYLNQGRYHRAIFQQYFKDREWIWPEYERWKDVFGRLGRFPVKWEQVDLQDKGVGLREQDITNRRLGLYTILVRGAKGRAVRCAGEVR